MTGSRAEAAGTALRALWHALPGLLGLLVLSYGCWRAWEPLGFIVPGALLLADRMWTTATGPAGGERE